MHLLLASSKVQGVAIIAGVQGRKWTFFFVALCRASLLRHFPDAGAWIETTFHQYTAEASSSQTLIQLLPLLAGIRISGRCPRLAYIISAAEPARIWSAIVPARSRLILKPQRGAGLQPAIFQCPSVHPSHAWRADSRLPGCPM